jgi:hypothetical protein
MAFCVSDQVRALLGLRGRLTQNAIVGYMIK